MKKAILAPDSFKGTLTSSEICTVMKNVILRHFPGCEAVSIPIADGGEGSVECFLTAMGGEKISIECTGAHFEKTTAGYVILPQEKTGGIKTAVVEMASCAGMHLAGKGSTPAETTTLGVGEMIKDAISGGCRKIILGLGGSCTNDFGCGALTALGVRFYDENGNEFVPVGKSLCRISRIDASGITEALGGAEIIAMCDVENPVYGKNGASYVFAPQKGADEATVRLLDEGLRHICGVIQTQYALDISALTGGGAAGAMAAGMHVFASAKLISGINTVLDTVNFDDIIKDADYVFTGEGLLDSQSLGGKVIYGIARRAKSAGVPVVALVGGAKDSEIQEIYNEGVGAVFTISRLPVDLSVSRHSSAENLAYEFDNILRLIRLSCQ